MTSYLDMILSQVKKAETGFNKNYLSKGHNSVLTLELISVDTKMHETANIPEYFFATFKVLAREDLPGAVGPFHEVGEVVKRAYDLLTKGKNGGTYFIRDMDSMFELNAQAAQAHPAGAEDAAATKAKRDMFVADAINKIVAQDGATGFRVHATMKYGKKSTGPGALVHPNFSPTSDAVNDTDNLPARKAAILQERAVDSTPF